MSSLIFMQMKAQLCRIFNGIQDERYINQNTQMFNKICAQEFSGVALMSIVVEEKDIDKKHLALTQLKNLCKTKKIKHSNPNRLTEQQHKYITQNSLQFALNLPKADKFLKTMKEIVQSIIPLKIPLSLSHDLAMQIEINEEKLQSIMQFMLGVAQNYKNNYSKEETIEFINLLEKILPIIHCKIKKMIEYPNEYPNELLVEKFIYLSTKFVYKSLIPNLSEVCLLEMTSFWALYAMNTISYEVRQYSKQVIENPDDQGSKETKKFYHFHGKKWAIKFLCKIMKRFFESEEMMSPQAIISKKKIEENYFQILPWNLLKCLTLTEPHKIKCEALILLQYIIAKRSSFIEPYIDNLQDIILPQLGFFKNYKKIEKDTFTMEFCLSEINQEDYETKVRQLSLSCWYLLASIDFCQGFYHEEYIVNKQKYMDSSLLKVHQNIMKSMRSDHPQQLQFWLAVFLKFRPILEVYRESEVIFSIRKILFTMIFQRNCNFIHIRLIENICGFEINLTFQQQEKIKQYLQILLSCNTGFSLQYYGLKLYTRALLPTINLKDIDISFISLLIQKCIQFIQACETPELVKCFKKLFFVFQKIKPLQADHFLITVQQKIIENIKKQVISDKVSNSINISEIIKTYIVILMSISDHGDSSQKVSEIITQILDQFYASDLEAEDYNDDLLYLLNRHLNNLSQRKKKLSQQMWFYFDYFVLRIVGYPMRDEKEINSVYDHIQSLALVSHHKIMIASTIDQDHRNLTQYVKCLKNYMKFIPGTYQIRTEIKIRQSIMTSNPLQVFFYLLCCCHPQSTNQCNVQEEMVKYEVANNLIIAYLENHLRQLSANICLKIVSFLMNQVNKKAFYEMYKYHLQIIGLMCYSNMKTFEETLIQIGRRCSKTPIFVFDYLMHLQTKKVSIDFINRIQKTSNLTFKRIIFGLTLLERRSTQPLSYFNILQQNIRKLLFEVLSRFIAKKKKQIQRDEIYDNSNSDKNTQHDESEQQYYQEEESDTDDEEDSNEYLAQAEKNQWYYTELRNFDTIMEIKRWVLLIMNVDYQLCFNIFQQHRQTILTVVYVLERERKIEPKQIEQFVEMLIYDVQDDQDGYEETL